MQSAPDPLSATLDEPRTLPGEHEAGQEDAAERGTDIRELARRRREIIKQVRSYAKETFDTLHAASRAETEELLKGAQSIGLDEEEIRGWEEFCSDALQAMQKAAHTLYHQRFMDPLLEALHDRVISKRVIRKLDREFRDENADFKDRESYILSVLPSRLKEWRRIKRERDDLVAKDPRVLKLTKKQVPRIAAFLDENTFADLEYPERKGLLDEVAAALAVQEGKMEEQEEAARAELLSFVERGILHRTKVGTWLKRIFAARRTRPTAAGRTPAQIETFLQTVVRPYAENWAAARGEFDDLSRGLEGAEVPRGFTPLTLDKFLLLSYPQKTSYLSLAWLRIEDPDALREKNRQLAALKLRIRHNLDIEDWEGAEEDLAKAERLSPENRELTSLRSFLTSHRPPRSGRKEQPDPRRVLEEMRDIVHGFPPDLQWMYTAALTQGPRVLHRFLQVSGNRVWVHEHGYATQEEDERNAEDERNRRQTKTYIDQGHSKQLERNVLKGETADDSAIRDDCAHAQMLYIGHDGREAFLRKIVKNVDNEGFGYWSTLMPDDVPYSKHREIVKNYHYKLKSGLRLLHAQGFLYTSVGPPVSLN